MVISNAGTWEPSRFTADIDLEQVCADVGRREKDEEGRIYVVYPVERCRKLFKLIKAYATPEQLEEAEETIRKSDKAYKIWGSLK